MKDYWVILASDSRRLYVGVTGDLEGRVREHRAGVGSKFTARYRIHRLVYMERFRDISDAIGREKQLKGWKREKKIRLIEARNLGWLDLAVDIDARFAEVPGGGQRRTGGGQRRTGGGQRRTGGG